VGEPIAWLIEQTMSQASTDNNTQQAVNEQGIKFFVRNFLVLVEFVYHPVSQ
jgi:hypothetical protein